jgi:hypothetical protein
MRRASQVVAVLSVVLVTAMLAGGVASSSQGKGKDSLKQQGGRNDGIVNTANEVYKAQGDGAPGGQQHGGPDGHLPPGSNNVVLVGSEEVTNIPGRVSDLAFRNKHAYLGAWSTGLPEPDCTGGAWSVDMSQPGNPQEVGFLKAAPSTYYTEGMHTLRLDTATFSGDVLLASVESCGQNARGTGGGLDIWDITDPDKPKLISRGAGDYTSDDMSGDVAAHPHQAHSSFGWNDGNKSYVALIDNTDLYDIDILDITNPFAPVLISETGFPEWPGLVTDAHGSLATSHDFVAKNIDGSWHLMVAYWDAGWVDLNVDDPANPQFLGESDYLDCDPVNPNACPPEGNGHQNEWNRSGNRFLATDEDQSPFRLVSELLTGPNQGTFDAGEFGWTVPIVDLPDLSMNGPTVFGGYGCPDDRPGIPTADESGVVAGPDEERILVLERGPVQDPNSPGDACFFSEKVETAQLLGYEGAIVSNHHSGAQAGATPDSFICGSKGHEFDTQIPGVCIGHRMQHLMFDTGVEPQTYPPDYTLPYPLGDPGDVEPDVGDIGADFAATATYDGWGYVHLFNANTMNEIDQLWQPATNNPARAQGFGDMSVHEVAVEKAKDLAKVAYFSWYDQGFRVAVFDGDEIQRSGFYIPEGGHDLWGVELCGFDGRGRRLVCVSDRDYGLFIYRYTGRTAPN